METKKAKTTVVVGLLALAGLVVFSLTAGGGNLEPSAPPGPTMKTLDEVYNAATSHISEREGYCKTHIVAVDSNETIFTVPTGKQFVLLSLSSGYDSVWHLTVNDNLFIDASIARQAMVEPVYVWWRDFPDRCVVVNAGETLKAWNESGGLGNVLYMTFIGYFHDVQ